MPQQHPQRLAEGLGALQAAAVGHPQGLLARHPMRDPIGQGGGELLIVLDQVDQTQTPGAAPDPGVLAQGEDAATVGIDDVPIVADQADGLQGLLLGLTGETEEDEGEVPQAGLPCRPQDVQPGVEVDPLLDQVHDPLAPGFDAPEDHGQTGPSHLLQALGSEGLLGPTVAEEVDRGSALLKTSRELLQPGRVHRLVDELEVLDPPAGPDVLDLRQDALDGTHIRLDAVVRVAEGALLPRTALRGPGDQDDLRSEVVLQRQAIQVRQPALGQWERLLREGEAGVGVLVGEDQVGDRLQRPAGFQGLEEVRHGRLALPHQHAVRKGLQEDRAIQKGLADPQEVVAPQGHVRARGLVSTQQAGQGQPPEELAVGVDRHADQPRFSPQQRTDLGGQEGQEGVLGGIPGEADQPVHRQGQPRSREVVESQPAGVMRQRHQFEGLVQGHPGPDQVDRIVEAIPVVEDADGFRNLPAGLLPDLPVSRQVLVDLEVACGQSAHLAGAIPGDPAQRQASLQELVGILRPGQRVVQVTRGEQTPIEGDVEIPGVDRDADPAQMPCQRRQGEMGIQRHPLRREDQPDPGLGPLGPGGDQI